MYFQCTENSPNQTSIEVNKQRFWVLTWRTERNSITTQLVLSSSCCCSWHDMNVWGPKVNLLREETDNQVLSIGCMNTTSFSHAKSATQKQKVLKIYGQPLDDDHDDDDEEWMNEWMTVISRSRTRKRKRSLCKVLVGSELFRRILLITILVWARTNTPSPPQGGGISAQDPYIDYSNLRLPYGYE